MKKGKKLRTFNSVKVQSAIKKPLNKSSHQHLLCLDMLNGLTKDFYKASATFPLSMNF